MPVEVHISERTGLRVMLARVAGPLVTCLVCVATEAVDHLPHWRQDDGLVHALEHMVLAGSDAFPHKGALEEETLNAAFSRASPAPSTVPVAPSTACSAPPGSVAAPADSLPFLFPPGGPVKALHQVDYTGYTLTTAGPAAFLALLPVLLDHVCFPLLSEAALTSQVRHVDGRGRDGGAVYEEMLAAELMGEEGGESSPRQRLLEALYPEGCGYRAVTGGRCSHLRMLSREAVRAYHAEYYRPENMAVIVTGPVETAELLAGLEGVEAKLLGAGRGREAGPLSGGLRGQEGGAGAARRSYAGLASTGDSASGLKVAKRPWHHIQTIALDVVGKGESGPRFERVTYPCSALPPASPTALSSGLRNLPYHEQTQPRSQGEEWGARQSQQEGQVLLGWLGPFWGDFEANLSIRILWLYLLEGPTAPLRTALVGEQGLCCEVTFAVQEGRPGSHFLQCDGVALSAMERVYPAFIEAAMAIAGGTEEEGGEEEAEETHVDMGRVRALIHRERVRYLQDMEEDTHASLTSLLLYTFLYGKRAGEAKEGEHATAAVGRSPSLVSEAEEAAQIKDHVQNTISRLEALPCREGSAEDTRYWRSLIRRVLLDARKTVVVLARSSSSLAQARKESDEQRQEEQARRLGPAELSQRARELESAEEEMARPCPPHLAEMLLTYASTLMPERNQKMGGDWGNNLPTVTLCTVRNVVTPSGKIKFEVFDSVETVGRENTETQRLPSQDFVAKGVDGVSARAVEVAKALHSDGLGSETCESPGPNDRLPFFLQWDHLGGTDFVTVTAWLETSALPDHLRPLLELWLEVLFELPVRQEDGSLWTSEEVTRYLQADTVSASSALGTGRSNFYAGIWSQAASISLKVEAEKYWLAVRWLRNLLYRTELCPDRIASAAGKLLADIEGYQRDGMSICSGLMRGLNFDAARSNHAATSFVRQYGVLTAVMQRLGTQPTGLLTDLAALQETLTQAWNLRIHVVCDVLAQPEPVRPWLRDFLPLSQARYAVKALHIAYTDSESGRQKQEQRDERKIPPYGVFGSPNSDAATRESDDVTLPPLSVTLSSVFCPVLQSRHLRTAECLNPSGKGLLISSPAIDAGYLVQCAPFDPIGDGLSYGSAGYAALLVAMEYLTRHAPLQHCQASHVTVASRGHAVETRADAAPSTSPGTGLNVEVEGASTGAAAGTSLRSIHPCSYELTCSPEQGILTLSFYRALNLTAAYSEAQDVVRSYAGGSLEVDTRALARAKSAVLFEYLDRIWTRPAAAQQSFLNYFRGTRPWFCTETMAAVQNVSAPEVVRAIRRHILRIFDVTRTSMVAACPSSQALALKFDLVRKLGRPVVESETIELCLARMAADEEAMSEIEGSTSDSDASLAQDLSERGNIGGVGGSVRSVKGWVGEVVMRRQDGLFFAAAMAGVAIVLAKKS